MNEYYQKYSKYDKISHYFNELHENNDRMLLECASKMKTLEEENHRLRQKLNALENYVRMISSHLNIQHYTEID
jgi:hypothetical protein